MFPPQETRAAPFLFLVPVCPFSSWQEAVMWRLVFSGGNGTKVSLSLDGGEVGDIQCQAIVLDRRACG